ncbi:Ras-like protein [Acrasis kona]|uniref:Ras-like protein n=1 Tax=Acrasis kona TaxID=1008807 RepID=A0AAW2ZQ42_9EUKA
MESLPTDMLVLILQYASDSFGQYLSHLLVNKEFNSLIVSNPHLMLQLTFKSELPDQYNRLITNGHIIYELFRPTKIIQAFELFTHYEKAVTFVKKEYLQSNWVKYQKTLWERSQSQSRTDEIQTVLLGDGGVGKSTISNRLVSNIFIEEYDPTIEDSYRICCEVNDEVYIIDMLDVAGQSEYSVMRDSYMRRCEVIIIVADAGNENTFDEIKVFIEQAQRIKDNICVPFLLILNKIDLVDNVDPLMEKLRKIGENSESAFVEYIAVSAKSGFNIRSITEKVVSIAMIASQTLPTRRVQLTKSIKKKCLLS